MPQPPIVLEFIDFGKMMILELLNESEEGFIDKQTAYDAVIAAWLGERGEGQRRGHHLADPDQKGTKNSRDRAR